MRSAPATAWALAAWVAAWYPAAGAAFDGASAGCVVQLAGEKALTTDARLAASAYPKSTGADGRWSTVPAGDRVAWTQGFFPGSLWLLHSATGDAAWRDRARRWTSPLAVQRTNRDSHDLGFKLFPSFGRELAATGSPEARAVLLEAAASLASRFDARVGGIDCCDWNPAWDVPLVIDTMVNLELLYWAAANGGDPAWRDQATAHALTTARDLVRPDGGTYHVADYSGATGALRSRGTFQGAGDETTWSRGQVWAMYGFALAYEYTRDPRMLAAARKVTEYWLARVPADGVPNWDFDSPRAQKDSSAASAAAAALARLADLVGDLEASRYRDAARRALDTLASPEYLDRSAGEAVLRHGVGHLPAGKEIDVGLVYGDYYLLEAALRLEPRPSACGEAAPREPPTSGGTPAPPPNAPAPGEPPAPSDLPTGPGGPAAAGSGSGGGCSTASGSGILAAAAAAGVLALRRRRR